jgi:class 3 adenylate cyclase
MLRHFPDMHQTEYVVLFADIASSMQLYNEHGDEGAKTLILGLQQQQTRLIEHCGGTVQDFTGDEIMARFEDCEKSIDASTRLHELAATFSDQNNVCLQLRIGLHYGPAIVEENRMFGDTVNIASRVASIAKGAQTITTAALVEQLSPATRSAARHYDITRIKGKFGLLDIYEYTWQSTGQTTMMLSRADLIGGSLLLTFNDVQTELLPHAQSFSIGRAAANSLVVHGNSVSRQHVSIDYQRSHFVISDNSTNGTYVYLTNGEEIYLRRQQLPIWGQGQLALGAPKNEGSDHIVSYRCQTADDATPKNH